MKVNITSFLIFISFSCNSFANFEIIHRQNFSNPRSLQIKEENNFDLPQILNEQDIKKIFKDKDILSSLKAQLENFKNTKGTILNLSQEKSDSNIHWQHLDPNVDKIEGVSSNKLYQQDLKLKEVVVAVIDSGVDVNHQDLQGSIWINSAEIPNNNIDDDNNGHIDDIFGWNFIGATDGMANIVKAHNLANGLRLIRGDPSKQVIADSFETTRAYVDLKEKSKISELSSKEKKQFERLKYQVESNRRTSLASFQHFSKLKEKYEFNFNLLNMAGLKEASLSEVKRFKVPPLNKSLVMAKIFLIDFLENIISIKHVDTLINFHNTLANICYNPDRNIRSEIVKDTNMDPLDRSYGNNDVIGPNSNHGTHIAGIIAANRDNEHGLKGIAKNVKIMSLRVTPIGDERDKDIANAIFYAVENGAKIINLSLGKKYSPQKILVDKAIQYAQNKDVLIIHAAGNEYLNLDENPSFPGPLLLNGDKFSNWIEVAATSSLLGPSLVANFSNYGKKSVDIFAPGVEIYSSISSNQYKIYSGTSMSAAVVSGVAATLWGAFPEVSALEIKNAIINGARKHEGLMLYKPRIGKVMFSKLGKNPSIVNLYDSMSFFKNASKASAQDH